MTDSLLPVGAFSQISFTKSLTIGNYSGTPDLTIN